MGGSIDIIVKTLVFRHLDDVGGSSLKEHAVIRFYALKLYGRGGDVGEFCQRCPIAKGKFKLLSGEVDRHDKGVPLVFLQRAMQQKGLVLVEMDTVVNVVEVGLVLVKHDERLAFFGQSAKIEREVVDHRPLVGCCHAVLAFHLYAHAYRNGVFFAGVFDVEKGLRDVFCGVGVEPEVVVEQHGRVVDGLVGREGPVGCCRIGNINQCLVVVADGCQFLGVLLHQNFFVVLALNEKLSAGVA